MVLKRKAVTPVIAVVLLLMMTVAVGGVAFMWLTKMQEDMQDDISKQQEEMRKKATAGLTITAAWEDSGGTIAILVRNSGSYTFNSEDIDDIEVYYDGKYIDTLDNYFTGGDCVGGTGLAPGESCEAIAGTEAWVSTNGHEFTVRLDEPSTGVKATKFCRINEAGQEAC